MTESNMFSQPIFKNGESFNDRITRLDDERKSNWAEIKNATLTSASGIFALSFFALQLRTADNPFLLGIAWSLLTISIATTLAAFWLDHSVSSSANKSHLKMGELLAAYLEKQIKGGELDIDSVEADFEKLVEDDQSDEDFRNRTRVWMSRSYAVANASLVGGVISLLAFGITNLPQTPINTPTP